jgi:hypothetical protein
VANGGTLIDRLVQSSGPALAVTLLANGTVRVRWPTNGADGFTLEGADSVTASTWSPVTQPPVLSGQRRVVTLTPTGAQRFFRLRR